MSSSCGVNFFSVFFLVQSIYMASKHGFPSKKNIDIHISVNEFHPKEKKKHKVGTYTT